MGERIEDYALIGDCRSAALVSRGGSIDWLCWPRFDSPSVFAAILDPRGGRFRVAPAGEARTERRYLPGTNVLETRFVSDGGALALLDFMVVAGEEEARGLFIPEHEILRIARCERGEVELEITFDPRPRYASRRGRWREAGKLGLRLELGSELFAFRAECPLALAGDGAVRTRVRLRAGETVRFSLVHAAETAAIFPPLGEGAEAALERTVRFWREWSARCTYRGPYRDAVTRSALTLKLLAFSPSGAIVAAPTTSLPERPGGDLNWDYRYCWLRDASFTARALFGLGYTDEAEDFVSWLLHSTRLTRPELRVLYDVYGRDPAAERELDHLAGYRGSRPVREGNAAKGQLQLDLYGEVVDAAAQFIESGGSFDRETGRMLVSFGDYVCRHWREPDEGIWEPRSGRSAHTFSKVLCWAALDRLLELHDKGHLPRADTDLFARTRALIREEVESRGYRDDLAAYTQSYGSASMDAALLLLPWYGYLPADAPRMRGTWRRILSELSAGGGLLYRYPESREVKEGAFGICGFWAAEYLALGGGRPEEAQAFFERQLGYANDLMLFAEEIDPATGKALGNFPQAFTHLGLINGALTLEDRLVGREQLTHHGPLQPAEEAEREASL